MSIVEFAIEQTEANGETFLRPVYAPGNQTTYDTEQVARAALMSLNGNGEDDETYRVVQRTVSDWTPAGADQPTDKCRCGHARSEHSTPFLGTGGVCAVLLNGNIGDDGHDVYADNCMSFASAV